MEHSFRLIQKRLVEELRGRMNPDKIKGMEVDEIGQVLKVCRENLHALHQAKMTETGTGEIKFITKVPLEKDKKV